MAFLQLSSEVCHPFIIPNLSPLSTPSTRKNSDSVDLATAAAVSTTTRPRKDSLTLL
ncbi:hypothetical protein NCAS_0E03080 [Naumovozyma castellii]|uniref:Uncharacterized protein n=1 Tax=Naumovozyma castellii TaxID=27288 RepID=G0VFV9_NAUCA|nr:hypothetical protein NCAS_0E03080 [Naumovozyma castellii CBS 4309]CCC70378.1 hypothetical protein NCAS_0E03080 [Naumovozyma castellii CBS 4309]